MLYRTIGVRCDHPGCNTNFEITGITTAAILKSKARQHGWAVSEVGCFCPNHRRQPQKKRPERTTPAYRQATPAELDDERHRTDTANHGKQQR